MRAFLNVIRFKYLGTAATVAMILLLPILVFSTQRTQTITGIAEGATLLTFSPISSDSSPIMKNVGDVFFLDVMLDPGNNLISAVLLDISYDPQKIRLTSNNPIMVNGSIFPVVAGPIYSSGRIQLTLSIGADKTKALSIQTRAVTLNFKTLESTNTTQVSFGSGTQTLTLSTNDESAKNVLSTTAPAYIKIN